MEISQAIKERFTEKGYEDIKNLLKTYVSLFNSNDKWNQDLVILGFGKVNIEDREECFGRIRAIADLLFIPIKLSKIEGDGKIDYKLEYG